MKISETEDDEKHIAVPVFAWEVFLAAQEKGFVVFMNLEPAVYTVPQNSCFKLISKNLQGKTFDRAQFLALLQH